MLLPPGEGEPIGLRKESLASAASPAASSLGFCGWSSTSSSLSPAKSRKKPRTASGGASEEEEEWSSSRRKM